MRLTPLQRLELEKSASPFARQCLTRITLPKRARILDIPCGFGRHSAWLASMGHQVTAIDIDAERVAATKKAGTELKGAQSMRGIVADADKRLPIAPNSFDLAIVVHYYEPKIFETVARALRPDGYLIFETFGAQGHNWQALPEFGLVEKLLKPHFEILNFRERKCGPNNAQAIVRALAKMQG